MRTFEGSQDARGLRFGIVASRFNEFVTDRLLAGALEALQKAGAPEDRIEVAKVPGAFEIPLVARRMAGSGRFDAVICLGAVIRGETPHFEYISQEASRGIAKAAWDTDVPVIFGVLTTDTVEQALDRAGSIERNKGAEAARTAIEMATLLAEMPIAKVDRAQMPVARPKKTKKRASRG
ncbi:MAG TPA: 6,7-dimethyl-8-ribityllumazine synthase [Nitrospiraceae bacterium]|nr:6,7-dimethyl-8-ribityllumazine synthase [Nitrospiraceae bacterium]